MIQKFVVESYDAWDSPDERTCINHGEFETASEAVSFAKKMIDKFLLKSLESKLCSGEAYDSFCHGGDVPMVFGEPKPEFHAFEYAKVRAEELYLGKCLEKAILIATEAHYGQIDKAGEPYILHPLRVMFNLETMEQKIVGVLHDVVEDCKDKGWTHEKLASEGFSQNVLEAVKAISKEDGENLENYLRRVESNSLATAVKLKDLKDNMDMTRISSLTNKDFERINRYTSTLQRLKSKRHS